MSVGPYTTYMEIDQRGLNGPKTGRAWQDSTRAEREKSNGIKQNVQSPWSHVEVKYFISVSGSCWVSRKHLTKQLPSALLPPLLGFHHKINISPTNLSPHPHSSENERALSVLYTVYTVYFFILFGGMGKVKVQTSPRKRNAKIKGTEYKIWMYLGVQL